MLPPPGRELVRLVCAGCSNKEIAMRTARTEGGVKVLPSRIFKKLHVTSRTRLIIALQQT
jgi:DNA-binding NarL/FixJ family response regulator